MTARNRNLLVIALTAALVSPVALAQKGESKGTIVGNVSTQAARDLPRPTLPAPAAERAVDRAATPMARPAIDTAPAGKKAGDSKGWTDARTPVKATTAANAAQGASHAAAHSSVVQRDAWTRLDSNGDGRISAIEADVDARFDGSFATMDGDRDGFVSDTEYRAFAKTEVGGGNANAAAHSAVSQRNLWTTLDADGDGRISVTEADVDSAFDARFAVLDGNRDGFISDVEYRAYAPAKPSQGAAHAAGHSAVVQRSVWSRLDADRDGRISPLEADVDVAFDARFDVVDGNDDGFVSEAELRADAKATHQDRDAGDDGN